MFRKIIINITFLFLLPYLLYILFLAIRHIKRQKIYFNQVTFDYMEKLINYFDYHKKQLKPHISCGFWTICLLIYLYA